MEQCPYVRYLVMDEKRTKSGHWLRLVLCVLFCALTLMARLQEVLLIPELVLQHMGGGHKREAEITHIYL